MNTKATLTAVLLLAASATFAAPSEEDKQKGIEAFCNAAANMAYDSMLSGLKGEKHPAIQKKLTENNRSHPERSQTCRLKSKTGRIRGTGHGSRQSRNGSLHEKHGRISDEGRLKKLQAAFCQTEEYQ